MATPNGYILVKKSEYEPRTPAPKQLSVILPDDSKENKELLLSKGQGASKALSSVKLPPLIDSTIRFRHTYRYIAQDASATVKSPRVTDLMESFGSLAVSTTQLFSLCSAFKLHKITIYPSTGTGMAYVNYDTYAGLPNAPDELKTKPIPTGQTVGGALVYPVPKGSQTSWWQSGHGNNNSLFNIAAPVGSIVDVDVTVCIQNTGTNVSNNAFSSLTAGLVYYPALDGRSTNDFAPVGRTNAT